MTRSLLIAVLLLLAACSFREPPQTFEQARLDLRHAVYFDRNDDGDFYCGCDWSWVGSSAGRIDFSSCGYEIRGQQERAERTEWEHVVPASVFGQTRQCWRDGGRQNCNRTDPVFNRIEADLHNLVPALGEVNADRANFRFGEIPGEPSEYGSCRFEVDTRARLAEPDDKVKGQIARIYFYMHERYNLPMDRSQRQILTQWHQQFPVSEWELERDRRISNIMGHSNPFVLAGAQQAGEPRAGEQRSREQQSREQRSTEQEVSERGSGEQAGGPVRGNSNSGVYHLPQGCPGFDSISPANRIEFASEQQALAAGYRKAGNCR